MKVEKILNLKHPISLVKYINSKVGVIDKANTFRMFDINDFSLMGGFKIKLPENNPLENSVDISINGNYLAVAIKGKRKTTIWDINQKKLIHTLGWHKGEVLSVSFDFDENYLITGGMDGRAYLWSVELGKMVSSLPPHPDYILSSAFSINSLWAATGSYDRMTSITNITSININYRKKAHRGAVTKIKFFKKFMISGDKTGELIVWDYPKGKILGRMHNVADMVIDMATDENEEYLFVITKTKYVYLYDLKTYELITDKFITLSELPSSITYVPENTMLWIGTLGGSIYIFDIYSDEKKLIEAVKNNKYDEAYELIKKNPFLERTEAYKQLDEIWNKTVSTAYRLMEKGEYDKAKQILAPFLAVPQKRTIIQNILKDFSEFEKFKQAVLKRKYPLAYSLAAMYPSFKDTIYYKKMEEDWKRVFAKAKELIKIRGKEDEIRKLFMPFRGVTSKTPLIQALFNDKQLYELLRNYLLSRKFDKFFELVQRNPFLYETPEYEQAMKFAKKLDEEIQKKLKETKFKEALSLAQMLEMFPEYKEKAKEYIKEANILSNFLSALANNEYDVIEKMAFEYPFLTENEDYIEFKNKITQKFKLAENEAMKGNIKKVSEILGDLYKSNIFKSKIENLIKSAYLNQLLGILVKKDKEKLQKGVDNYIAYFGFDNEIEDIIKMAKKLGMNLEIKNTEKSRFLDFNNLPNFIWED